MYTLHWSPNTGAFAPHAALAEVGAEYELVEVDLDADEHHSPAFLRINRRAQVPVLELLDGAVMTESVAMLLHIADCHPRAALLPVQPGRARAYRWLLFCALNLYEAVCRSGDPHHYSDRAADFDGIQAKALVDIDRYWDMVVSDLSGPYFLGDHFSVVDLYLYMLMQWHAKPAALRERLPALDVLSSQVEKRPALADVFVKHYALPS
jgi:glutathione S-transferase